MTKILLAAALACGMILPTSAHAACASLSGSGVVVADHYDPLGGGVAQAQFLLEFTRGPDGAGVFYIQFVDRDANTGEARVGASGPGPYTITGISSGGANLVAGDVIEPPQTMGDGGGWLRVAFHGDAPARADLRFAVTEAFVAAGVYNEAVDIRIACPSGSLFEYDLLAGALDLEVAVDNTLRVDGGATPTIDLGDLSAMGASAEAGVDLPVQAAGAFDISFASGNADGAASGVGLLRRDGGATADPASQIAYAVRVDRQLVSSQGQQVRCAGRSSPLRVDVVTDAAPAAGRRAGQYRDILEVTLTPNLDGPPAVGGCALLQ